MKASPFPLLRDADRKPRCRLKTRRHAISLTPAQAALLVEAISMLLEDWSQGPLQAHPAEKALKKLDERLAKIKFQ